MFQDHITGLTLHNRQGPSIQYRDPIGDQDIVEAVYRWDDRSHTEIFRTGFLPRDRGSTTWEDYYNLERHVNGGGAPGDTSPVDGSVFVSTTRSTRWRPRMTTTMIIYRYEIFVPGGIDAVLTLREHNDYLNQQEIAFVGGIDPQYIRSARPYVFLSSEPGSQFPSYTPHGNQIYPNDHFNPNPNSSGQTTQEFRNRLRNIWCPTREEVMINLDDTTNLQKRDIRDVTSPTEVPYLDPGCNVGHYVDCAFNFNNQVEAFIFTTDQCLQINYAPGTTEDFIIKGPMSIGDFFPSLINTIFATGIDAAFTSSAENEVYIFRSNIYILLNFVSGDIIGGPKKITDGFYSLKNTIFEHGIDAAFASSRDEEAYIFKGDQYALINFAPGTTDDYLLNPPKKITLSFPSLKGTVFEDGLDAAFSAKATNEAYIFKGNSYALINYAPGTTDDYIINFVTPISDGFQSLKGIIPRYPCGC
ncbi:hypothetical protein LguiA_002058 [Lonicera macranthoides]